ncbi:hypothetical protein [Marinivivus vitaminiproducens]|uniref:hypothetical protein n=1 Tax=Marinivivus vitaminiproducens TaxID=3035935 RepID=UPI0027A903DC|nr:hypothetical protein P4R82_02365 [Geminicoccaceae bacterium SCSIO 64248]
MTKENCAWCKWGGLAAAASCFGGLFGAGVDPLGSTQFLLLAGGIVGGTASVCAFHIDRTRQASWR